MCETYPNEGPLWPCGCLMGDPACHCGADEDKGPEPVHGQSWGEVNGDPD